MSDGLEQWSAEFVAFSALVSAMCAHDPLGAKVLAKLSTLPSERAIRLLAAWVVALTSAGSVEVHDAAREAVRRMCDG